MDIYYRNVDKYVDAANTIGATKFVWSFGEIARRRMDVPKWCRLNFAGRTDWEAMVIAVEGAAVYDHTSKDISDSIAAYPVWQIDMGMEALEDYCANPVSERTRLTNPARDAKDENKGQFRPRVGQPHKVVIFAPPRVAGREGQETYAQMGELKKRYPEVEWIVYNTSSFRVMFGGLFAGAGYDPYVKARSHLLQMPVGKVVQWSERHEWAMWFEYLGYDIDDAWEFITERTMFNIESVNWAMQNYDKGARFRMRVLEDVDIDSPDADYLDEEYNRGRWFGKTALNMRNVLPGDGIVCDACSLISICKAYREGAVCIVAGADGAKLAEMFGSRDADQIINGLSELVKIQSERVAADVNEEVHGERDLATDKRIKDLFDHGTKLTKLVAPERFGPKGTTVNVGVAGSGAQVTVSTTPQELIAGTVRALEAAGVRREDITQDTIRKVLSGMTPELVATEEGFRSGRIIEAPRVESV